MGVLTTLLNLVISSVWLWALVLALVLFWTYMKFWITHYDSNTCRTDDKVFLITGAESGIGMKCADLLAARGGRVIMACKDLAKGKTARDQIVKRSLNEKVEVYPLDLSCLKSVRKFSEEIHSSVGKLDALINNAAVAHALHQTTIDGLNTIMQVNHFGPFLLTNLLLDLLKKSGQGRIVFVSSVIHHFHKFSLDNLNCEKEALPEWRIYCNSKLANIITARYFARMLKGTGVTVNSAHPGMTPTALTSSCTGSLLGLLCSFYVNIFGRSNFDAAATPAYLASEPKISNVTGKHFAECRVSGCVSRIADDLKIQDKLFEKSVQLVQLRPEEKHF